MNAGRDREKREIARLRDLLPAEWRMHNAVTFERGMPPQAIASTPILPWARTVRVTLDSSLWWQLPQESRDLLFLREVTWRQSSRWVRWGAYQGVVATAVAGSVVELVQGDPAGIAIGALLATVAAVRIVRDSRSPRQEVEADSEAVEIAEKRGYTRAIAAKHLLEGIDRLASLENRPSLSFTELVRVQNLRAIAGLSAVGMPSDLELR